jgi:pSer/pThr/pTyr-binding forkhead associated (FHA) protein
MNASSPRKRHLSQHVPNRSQFSKLRLALSQRPVGMSPASSPELKSGHRLKAAPPVSARYRLRWAYQELEVPAGTEFSIGRAPECLLRLTSTQVSRHHARFRHGSEGPSIEDLGSLNGVRVNQRKIAGVTALRHGDTIAIGDEELRLVDVDVVEATARQSTLRVGPHRSRDEGSNQANIPPSLSVLSAREREVFALMVQGHTPSEIALRLRLGVKTVERKRRRIADKLECGSRAELVTYAICAGLLRKL